MWNQFPKKWTTLPGIGASPEPRQDNALVPYNGVRHYDDGPGSRIGGSGYGDVEDRVRMLEERLVQSDKSNRALLEEVIRLQSDFKGVSRRQDDSLSMERKTRMQLENSLWASNDLIAQMANRIKRTEERLQEEHSTVSALVTHTKNMEQNLIAQGKETFSRKELQSNRMQELRAELDEVVRAKDSIERVSYALVDEVRQLKVKVDTQSSDLATQTSDLKARTRRLEDGNRQGLDVLRRQNETQATAEVTTTQLRQQVESRLTELRDVIMELRNRQEQGNQDTHRVEQQMHMKMSEMTAAIQEQARKREEALHAFEMMQREKDHTADIEKTKLQGKILEIAEEVSKKMVAKESKLREDLQHRCTQLEASEKKKQNERLQKLMEAQNLLDKQQEELKKAQDKLLVAEIHSRKKHEKQSNEKMEALEEKLGVVTTTLQQALSGVSMQVNTIADKLREEMKDMTVEESAKVTRTYTDLDARISSQANKINQLEKLFDAKLQAVAAVQGQHMRDKVESISLWQEVTQQTLKEIQNQVQVASGEFHLADERENLMKAEVKQRVAAESETRTREVEELKKEMSDLKRKVNNVKGKATEEIEVNDLENIQASIRKLAESIATVKSVLSMKMQADQKLWADEVKALQDEVARLSALLEPLVKERFKPPRLFVKPDAAGHEPLEQLERNAPSINKWSIYTAYRWLAIKQRWLYLKWQREYGTQKVAFLHWTLPSTNAKDKDLQKGDEESIHEYR